MKKVKTLRQISFMIAWSGMINMAVTMLAVTVLKVLIDFHTISAEFEIAGMAVTLYGIWVLVASVIAANKIDRIADERREAIRRRKLEQKQKLNKVS